MSYLDLLHNGASTTDIRKHLVSGEQSTITVRLPITLRDAAKDKAALKGMSFSAYVREQLIEDLIKEVATNGR